MGFGRFLANLMGCMVEYKTFQEIHIRLFARIYNGAGGILLGISVPLAFDFKRFTAGISLPLAFDFERFTPGISPEIGIGIASFNLFYRYHFYLDTDFNCPEFSLVYVPVNFN